MKKRSQRTVGITFSTFDLLHAGHVAMLREAKNHCDYLIAGIQTDPTIDRPDTKNKPVQTLVERYAQLAAVKYVDEIIPYQTEQDLIDILNMYEIDIRILGEEYKDQDFTGKDACNKRGIDLYFNKREHRFSTSDLRERVENAPRTNGKSKTEAQRT
jgi:glycerol-3-phosphate cytidylyltransferase